ncbi:Prostaglandin E synthase 2 [Chlorella vulgaris]
MRAAVRAAHGALRRLQGSKALVEHLQQLQMLSTATGTAASPRSGGNLGWVAVAAGAAAASYGFAAQPVAQAEAPWQGEKGTPSVPAEERYVRPSGAKGVLPKELVLYQYEVCPFCCKVKAFLDYHKIPYRCVEVNPLTKGEIKWSQYKKVPVIVVDGEQVNDSSAIISRLAAEIDARGGSSGGGKPASSSSSKRSWFGGGSKSSSAAAPGPATVAEEEKWRRWVDDWFVRVITVNIYRSMHESFQTFDYISEAGNFGWVSREAARVFGASLMWGIGGKLRRKYGVEGDVREALYKSANEWAAAVGDRRFLGGDAPDLADLAVFGVIRAVTGTDTFNDLMQNTNIGGWYARMFTTVGPSSRVA